MSITAKITRSLLLTAVAFQAVSTMAADPVRPAVTEGELSGRQQQLYRDYERFEKGLFDVAEQARRKDPERSELLYRARSQSQEQNILTEMQTISELLRAGDTTKGGGSPQYGPAADRQRELLARMEGLLKLLQSLDDRDRIATDIARLQELLKENNRLIARQKDVRADTLRGKPNAQLQAAQKKVADEADKLGDKIDQQDQERDKERSPQPSSKQEQQGKGEQKEGDPSEKKEGADSKEQTPGEKSPSDKPKEGESPESQDGKTPSDSQKPPQGGEKSPDQPPSKGSQPPGQPGQSKPQPQQQRTPGREELEQARREMQQAIEELQKEDPNKAAEEQDQAVAKLEQMKARLEEILRQLREEEKESYLTLLEARFQNMLKRQQRVNSETVRLDSIPATDRAQQNYASQTDNIRKEQNDNALEAEKALALLKHEGSSVAFPEAVEQMHRSMLVAGNRLAAQDTGKTTQLVERLIVETLEEMITSLRNELEKNEQKQQRPPGQQPSGEPQDPGLVGQLAELKLIRSLQLQVNRLTSEIGTELDGKSPPDSTQVDLLRDLAGRQRRLQEATYDLSVGRNK